MNGSAPILFKKNHQFTFTHFSSDKLRERRMLHDHTPSASALARARCTGRLGRLRGPAPTGRCTAGGTHASRFTTSPSSTLARHGALVPLGVSLLLVCRTAIDETTTTARAPSCTSSLSLLSYKPLHSTHGSVGVAVNERSILIQKMRKTETTTMALTFRCFRCASRARE